MATRYGHRTRHRRSVQNAYVTGTTTSSNPAATQYPFPASPNGFQTVSNSPGNLQFFASKISTTASGYQSMLYSTYFGGGYPSAATGVPIIAVGGGIAVDPPPNTSPNMYFTGTTNMLNQIPTGLGLAPFPLFNAQQSCLNESGKNNCTVPANPDDHSGRLRRQDQPEPGCLQSGLLHLYRRQR